MNEDLEEIADEIDALADAIQILISQHQPETLTIVKLENAIAKLREAEDDLRFLL